METGSRVQGGGGEEEDESMRVFREGIELAINFNRGFQMNVKKGYLGPEPYLRIHNLCDRIFSCFIQSKDQPQPPTKIALKELLSSSLHYHNKSVKEVRDELLAMYQECLRGDFTSIQLYKEANARRPMWKQLNNFEIPEKPWLEKMKKQNLILYGGCQDARKFSFYPLYLRWIDTQHQTLARKSKKQKCTIRTETPSVQIPKICCHLMQKPVNSSEMDGSRVLQVQGDLMTVFKEGLGLFINNMWTRRFSVDQPGCSNPTPMLQYLADVIFFWFTQTIKPLSFDHIVRILNNETYSLPYGTMHHDLIKKGVKKLMVMYEECLQGNFSSVDILREESLSLAGSFEEIIVTVTHRPGYGTHTRWV